MIDTIQPPTRFTGLHAHSSFSTFDGLGYPQDHIDFVLSEEQGMDSWALTDHGNGSGLAHAQLYSAKKKKSGRNYRQLYGVEFYFVPSLEEWSKQYAAHEQAVKDAKDAKKKEALAKSPVVIDAEEDVESSGLIIENEEETKKAKINKPEWKRYYHLVIIAKNRIGLGNLFLLVKKSYKYGYYRFPRIDYKMLKEHGEGLVVSTACVGGYPSSLIYREFPDLSFSDLHPDLLRGPQAEAAAKNIMSRLENAVDQFVDCVGKDSFFLEMQFNDLPAQHLTNYCLMQLSEKTKVPLVATADSHFPSPDKWQARELYKKLGWMGAKLDAQMLPKLEDMKTMLYPKNASQMWEEFKKGYEEYDFYRGKEETVKSAIERTHDIAWQHCDEAWIDTHAKLPRYGSPEKTAFQQLSDLVKQAMVREGFSDKPEYIERVKEEMSDIKFLGHESYFLALYEILNKSKEKTFLGPGRGSGGGSLVNYLLGITHIDPIPYGLLWNRFLGRHKASWPDIDTDAGDRDVLIEAAQELFGQGSVLPVSNFNTLKLKSLVKDISKFYGVPFEEVNAMTGPLEEEVKAQAKEDNMEKSAFILKHEDCMAYSPAYKQFMEKYPDVERHVQVLFKENRSIGRHAAGVIVAPEEVIERSMPIIAVRGELQTPWTEGLNYRTLENNGFLKYDFLGLTLLKDVENCIYRILKSKGNPNPTFQEAKKFFDENLNCRFNKQDDMKVWKHVYEDGHFTGIFQFTAPGARNFCLEVKPKDINELSAITAIYRPGPLKANVHKKYVKAKLGADSIKYDHPVIKKVLGPTYNFVVFQEQFMTLASELAGFSPGDSDKLRKTLVKTSIEGAAGKVDEREVAKRQFIEGAEKLHSVKREISTNLWETIEAFAAYGFNKSHSVAYSIDSYYAAWLHTHYEYEWLSTILQSENGNPDGLTKTIAEIKSYGHKFAPIDINYSGNEWTFSEKIGAFVPPLSSVKGIGDSAMQEILNNRPYKSLRDMFYTPEGAWRHAKLNKSCLTSLCKIEALGSLEELQMGTVRHHKQLLDALLSEGNYDSLKKGYYGMTETQIKRMRKAGQEPDVFLDKILEEFEGTEDWTRPEKIEMSYDLTSTVDSDLLFPSSLMQKLEAKQIDPLADIPSGGKGIGWFMLVDFVVKKTQKGKVYYRFKTVDNKNRTSWIRVWGDFEDDPEKYTIWMTSASSDPNWGFSTSVENLRKIT